MRLICTLTLVLLLVNQTLTAQMQSFERLPIPLIQNGIELPAGFAGGLNNPQFSAADLNQDGIQDMVIFDRAGDVVLTYLNSGVPGANSYTFAPDYACNFPKLTDYAMMRDYNQDGAADIFCASLSAGAQEMSVFRGYYENNTLKFTPYYFNYPNCTYCNPTQVWYPDQDQPGDWNNLLIAPTDIPAVDDIDGDGDLDILTFDPAGGHIWYAQNRSVEMGFGIDSLKYHVVDKCWGRFYESGLVACHCDLSDNASNCSNGLTDGSLEERNERHPGSTLMTFDQEGDGDKEIVLGDVSFECLNLLNNGGSAASAWMTSQDESFPSYNTPLSLFTFPAAFYLDVDNDGKRDMVVAPNNRNIGEDQKNVWFYRNTAATGHHFELQGKSLFIGDMLDLGSGTHPTFADVNADGLKDMIVGTYGFFTTQSSTNARLYLFLNTGTATEPRFELVNNDWLNFSEFTPENYDFSPAFGDLDGDGDLDLLVGHNDGGFFYYRNSAGPGAPMILSRVFDSMWLDMDVVGLVSAPTLYDLTGDGLLDIIAGERNGNVNLFTNIGTINNPLFPLTPTIQKLGFVDTRLFGEAVGFSTPNFIPTPNGLLLVCGSNSGQLKAYQNFTLGDTFDLVDPVWGNVDEGGRTHPAFADLDNDGILEMVVGNLRGGLGMFRTTLVDCSTVNTIQPASDEPSIRISPSPAHDRFQIELPALIPYRWQVFSATGHSMAAGKTSGGKTVVETNNWESGVYFLQIEAGGSRVVRKVVVI